LPVCERAVDFLPLKLRLRKRYKKLPREIARPEETRHDPPAP
jgi:hypothetical protein